MSRADASRVEGLDMLRGFAVLGVACFHFLVLLPPEIFPGLRASAWFGANLADALVEAFFALSGFLIGGEMLRRLPGGASPRYLADYAIRRATRILPMYHVALLALTACDWALTGCWDVRVRHLVFLQAYGGELGFLGTAWSLAVEFWSYIFLPIVVFAFPRLLPDRIPPVRRILLVSAAIAALMMAARMGTALDASVPWDDGIRKMPHLRMDALLYGLAAACCREEFPALWDRLRSGACLAAVILAWAALLAWEQTDAAARDTGIARLLFAGPVRTLNGILAALLLPFLTRPILPDFCRRRCPCVLRALQDLARCSFSLYLLHLPLFFGAPACFQGLRSGDPAADAALVLILMGAAVILCACLTSWCRRFVEEPAMNLRGLFRRLLRL